MYATIRKIRIFATRKNIISSLLSIHTFIMATPTPSISIAPATIHDAAFVARCVCMALHHEPSEQELPGIAGICSRTDVLYSYRHALIAWDGDRPVGLCLAYPGEGYHDIRVRTFEAFASLHPDQDDEMDLANAEDETAAGEYYIDSLAVLPQYRRRGIGRLLMQAQIERGRLAGYSRHTLLVDPANPSAQRLYTSLGFVHEGDCYAFGQIYWKWVLKIRVY